MWGCPLHGLVSYSHNKRGKGSGNFAAATPAHLLSVWVHNSLAKTTKQLLVVSQLFQTLWFPTEVVIAAVMWQNSVLHVIGLPPSPLHMHTHTHRPLSGGTLCGDAISNRCTWGQLLPILHSPPKVTQWKQDRISGKSKEHLSRKPRAHRFKSNTLDSWGQFWPREKRSGH